MKAQLLENEVVKILDLDIRTALLEDVKEVGKLAHKHLLVIIPKQYGIFPDDLTRFCEQIGEVHKIPPDKDFDRHRRHTAEHDNWNGVLRVTGELNQDGDPGLFPHKEELRWHIDEASNPNRNCFIALHGVKGTSGSVTGFINNALAYDNLNTDIKDRIRNIMFRCGQSHGSYSPKDYSFFKEHTNQENTFNLVHTNNGNQTGLFFPFNQIKGLKGHTSIVEKGRTTGLFHMLKDHVTQKMFMYDHHWNDGDLLIIEQNLQLHKRYYFNDIEKRLLYRVSFNDSRL